MRWRFGPDDEDAFGSARDELVARFEQGPGGRDLGWVAGSILDMKWGYLDGDLSRWTAGDVEEILLGLIPAKVMLDPGDLGAVVAGFAGLLRFFGAEGIIPEGDGVRLAALAEELGPRFRSAALDRDNWSMGKRLWSAAAAEGVDPTDPEAVQQFTDDFNRRPFSERDAVLGPLPGDRGLGAVLLGPLPPIVLPPEEELAAAAQETVWVERLRRLVGYVGEGRPLTDRGNLRLADGKALAELLETGDSFDGEIAGRVFKTRSTVEMGGVHLTFTLALESGMLEWRGKKVVPGPNADAADDPLEAAYLAWLVLVSRIGPTQFWYRGHGYGWDWYAEELDRSLPVMLMETYRDGPLSVENLAEETWEHLLGTFDLSGVEPSKLAFHRELVEDSLRRAFDLLAELGTVVLADEEEEADAYGPARRRGGVVGLTPLGKWAVQRLASRVTEAPVAGALREATAAHLLEAVSDLPEPLAAAEIDAWIADRGQAAAEELVAALPGADETGRGLGFRALLGIGPGAADAVGRLAGHPDLDPYVTVWRVDSLAAGPAEVDCGGDPERFVRLLGAVVDLWGPQAAVAWVGPAAGAEDPATVLDRAWRVGRPETEVVLAALGGEHPDRRIAKAARRALFKHRSRPG